MFSRLIPRRTPRQRNIRLTILLTYFSYVTSLLAESRYSDEDITIQQFVERLLEIGSYNAVADEEFGNEHITFIANYLIYLRNPRSDHKVVLHELVKWIETGGATKLEE